MNKKYLTLLKKYFYSQEWVNKVYYKKLPSDVGAFNHLNIFFNHNPNLQNKISVKNYFIKNKSLEQDQYYNTFDWLISAKKIGGAESLYFFFFLIQLWIKDNFSKNSIFWNNIYCAKRLINLIYAYDFFTVSSNEFEKKIFDKLIFKHYLLNNIFIKNMPLSTLSIENIKGDTLLRLIYGLKVEENLLLIKKQIIQNVDQNGFHKSYNAISHTEYINNLIELKNILLLFNIKKISEINFQITNMSSVLNNLFHKDNSIALFNGSHNMFNKNIIKILKDNDDLKNRELYKNNNGLSIYADKDKKIFFDVVVPTNKFINENLHSGTLSFEFSANKEKIFTNCGSKNIIYGKKLNYLRYSAAHSTIILNNTNISELKQNKTNLRIPKNIQYNFDEKLDELILSGSHDGYKENYKKIVKRQLFISKKQNCISGKDTIMPIKLNSKKIIYSIRFHLMPDIQISLTNSKKKVILKTKNKKTWIFESISKINIEESIYIGDDNKAQQNKQIVINGFSSGTIQIEKWSLKEI